jgi:hypothetical protein
MDIQQLTITINKVCPIDGLDINRNIWFKEEATEEQKTLAYEIYDNWQDIPDPDITGFVLSLATNETVNNWYEGLPKLINNLLAIYLKDENFDLINQIITGLEIPEDVAMELQTQLILFNIPIII